MARCIGHPPIPDLPPPGGADEATVQAFQALGRGSIVEQGSHPRLLAAGGSYSDPYNSQFVEALAEAYSDAPRGATLLIMGKSCRPSLGPR
jgi:hypothetical protein